MTTTWTEPRFSILLLNHGIPGREDRQPFNGLTSEDNSYSMCLQDAFWNILHEPLWFLKTKMRKEEHVIHTESCSNFLSLIWFLLSNQLLHSPLSPFPSTGGMYSLLCLLQLFFFGSSLRQLFEQIRSDRKRPVNPTTSALNILQPFDDPGWKENVLNLEMFARIVTLKIFWDEAKKRRREDGQEK